MGLNFETKEKYETSGQKFQIFYIYAIGYFSVFVAVFNIYYHSSQLLPYHFHNPPIPVPESLKILFYFSLAFLVFSISNIFFANSYKKKNPYKLNKSFVGFILINLFILAPISLVDVPTFFNNLLFILFIVNALLLILFFGFSKVFKNNRVQEKSDFENIDKINPNTPANFILCPNCKMKIRPDVIYCPTCHHKLAR